MSFAYPWVLLFLAIPVVLIVAPPVRHFGLVLPFDYEEHQPRKWLSRILACFDRLPALVLAGAILLIAGPQSLKKPSNVRSLTNIQLCLDVSGSMRSANRYENARRAIEQFLTKRTGDAFGLTLFGSHQIRWTPLTTDLAAIRHALPFANPRRQPPHMSGTRIGAALLFCRDNMSYEATQGDRLIILVSDGASSDLGSGAEADYAKELSDAEITLFHIHVGSSSPPEPVREIAVQTGGKAFAARDMSSLNRVFQYIDRMSPAEFLPGGTVPMDNFYPFAVAVLSLLGAHLIGLLGLRYTPW